MEQHREVGKVAYSRSGDCINVNTEDIAEDAWILDLEDIEKDTGMVLKKVTKAQRNSVRYKAQISFRTSIV